MMMMVRMMGMMLMMLVDNLVIVSHHIFIIQRVVRVLSGQPPVLPGKVVVMMMGKIVQVTAFWMDWNWRGLHHFLP